MKRFTLALTVFVLAAVASADALRSQIEAMNGKMHSVMMKKDINGFIKAVKGGITKDFKYSENGQFETFDQMVAGMKQGFAMMGKISVANAKIVSLKEKGNNATCVTRHTMVGTQVGNDKKSHKFEFSGISTDTYRKEKGKWMMASMTWGKQQIKMDNKVMDPTKMGGG